MALLRTAAWSPVHAYLLVGPPGAGRGEAARAFAGSLFASGAPDGPDSPSASRHRRLSAVGHHPDLLEVEPEGRSLLVADAREITVEGWRSPVEATHKVVVVDRFDTAEPEAVASLLKTIEEPPATTVFVLLSEEVPDSHVTVASRCVRVDLPPLTDEVVSDVLKADGVPSDRATELAEAAAGSLSRGPRVLAQDPGVPRAAKRLARRSIPPGRNRGGGRRGGRGDAGLDRRGSGAASDPPRRGAGRVD
ncbi:MAG: hypothetical protein Ct9H300mP31_05120 [Acidimicrobiaceae bacterium]|nr:MAG: hypothetical protein Ct9H300mP31_05120 [Acidimicrobiaceae bacterium]